MLLVQLSMHTFGDTADVLTRRGNPLGLGIRVIIFKVGIGGLKQLGYVNKLDIWIPQKLNEIQLTKRISICDSLLKRNETDPFLKRIITDDEK